MLRSRLAPALSLALAGLAAACALPGSTYNNGGQVLQLPGAEQAANALVKRNQGYLDTQLLKLLHLRFDDLAAFDKDKDGRLSAKEVAAALDLTTYDNWELTRFFANPGLDAAQTIPANVMPQADRNADGRISVQEWRYAVRDDLVRRLGIAPTDMIESTVGMLWARPDLQPTYDRLAIGLFDAIDGNQDQKVAEDEISKFGGDARVFKAAAHGSISPVNQLAFGAMLRDGRGGFLKEVGTILTDLDLNHDNELTKTEIAAGYGKPEYGRALALMQLDKDAFTRFELERYLLKVFISPPVQQPPVQTMLVRWTWPSLGGGPGPSPSPSPKPSPSVRPGP